MQFVISCSPVTNVASHACFSHSILAGSIYIFSPFSGYAIEFLTDHSYIRYNIDFDILERGATQYLHFLGSARIYYHFKSIKIRKDVSGELAAAHLVDSPGDFCETRW